MGGGGPMRTAAKIAAAGVFNSGKRGGISAANSSAEHSVRTASRPTSAVISSGKEAGADSVVVQQSPCELNDWLYLEPWEPMPRIVFDGAPNVQEGTLATTEVKDVPENERIGVLSEDKKSDGMQHSQLYSDATIEPIPGVVLGGVPSLEEAKEATTVLKDVLEKYSVSNDSSGVGELCGSLRSSDKVETGSCIISEPKAGPVSNYAFQAFAFLNQNPEAQTVVASIASDPNVWNAVMKNDALVEYLKSQKTTVTDEEFQAPESPRKFSEFSDDASSKAENIKADFFVRNIFENIKISVIEMANNVSAFVQSIFGFSPAGKEAADGKAKPTFNEIAMGASFFGLALMVIMVVVLKRPV